MGSESGEGATRLRCCLPCLQHPRKKPQGLYNRPCYIHVSRVCYLVSTSGLLCLSTVCEGKLRRHSAASKVPRMALRYGRRVLACGREHSSRERGAARSNNEMRSFNKCLGYLDAPRFTTFTTGYVSTRVTYHVLETRAPRVVSVRKLVGIRKKKGAQYVGKRVIPRGGRKLLFRSPQNRRWRASISI